MCCIWVFFICYNIDKLRKEVMDLEVILKMI